MPQTISLSPADLERVVAVIKATCAVCTSGDGKVDNMEAVTVLVGALTAFAGCTSLPVEAIRIAISGLEDARAVYLRHADLMAARLAEAS
jgi:hypothetical protein